MNGAPDLGDISRLAAAAQFERVAEALVRDEDMDVERNSDVLVVRGRVFAYLDGSTLVVELPFERAADLRSRNVVAGVSNAHQPDRNWVRVEDLELWPELAREAHEFVGEPHVGRQS